MPDTPRRAPFFESLEGPRIVIRPYQDTDALALYTAITESRDRLRPWLPFANAHQTEDETRDFIARARVGWTIGEDMNLGIFARDSGAFLGGIGFHPRSWDVPWFEIGYWLRTGAEGHGYMAEAVRVLADFAFTSLGANRVEIRCDARNVRSAAVAERLGFVREGILRNQQRTPADELRDTLVFALTPTDKRWPPRSL
jgi:RimJ/RimL family protein N-acetyltransferase